MKGHRSLAVQISFRETYSPEYYTPDARRNISHAALFPKLHASR
jgi:hypothetical protein